MDQCVEFAINALHSRRVRIVSLEGSIGAGKSRLMEAMGVLIRAQGLSAITAENERVGAQRVRYLLVPEPVESWTEQEYETRPLNSGQSERRSIFSLFYSDMRRWGFLFQIKAFTSRLRYMCEQLQRLETEFTEAGCEVVLLMERSLLVDRIFIRNLYESGVIATAEWDIYCEFYDTITTATTRHHDLIMYVDTPPAKCDARIKQRGREGEEDIPMQYLLDLHAQHLRMLDDFAALSGRFVQRVHFSDDMTQDAINCVAHNLVLGPASPLLQ